MTKTLHRRVFSCLPVVISPPAGRHRPPPSLPRPRASLPIHTPLLFCQIRWRERRAVAFRTLFSPLCLFTPLQQTLVPFTPLTFPALLPAFGHRLAQPGTRTPPTLVLLRAPLALPLAFSDNKQPHAGNLSLCTFGCRLTSVANNVQKERLGGRCCGSFSCRMPAVLPCSPL